MSSRRWLFAVAMCGVAACANSPLAERDSTLSATPRGKPLTGAQSAALFQTIYPNGTGLPPGRGTVAQGRELYAQRCAVCHGKDGIGASAEELGQGTGALTSASPDKTIGLYWPYATTLFDFIRRAMPMNAPQSLTDDEVYALTAYLLRLNGIDWGSDVLTSHTLPSVKMPNREGFIQIEGPHQPLRN
jgi:S-disulfanyl-L-cysteine oxidoreductase SoxD